MWLLPDAGIGAPARGTAGENGGFPGLPIRDMGLCG